MRVQAIPKLDRGNRARRVNHVAPILAVARRSPQIKVTAHAGAVLPGPLKAQIQQADLRTRIREKNPRTRSIRELRTLRISQVLARRGSIGA
jgi:hypothetical protein